MKRFTWLGLAGACLLWAALPITAQEFRDSRLERIADPIAAKLPASRKPPSDEVMRATLRTAATVKGWRVETDTPGRMELSLTLRQHTARIELTYEAGEYAIRYLESENLLYDAQAKSPQGPARAIHRTYNAWVNELAQAFNAALGIQAIAAPAAPAAAAVTVATSSKPAEGMPAPGTRWRYAHRDQQYKTREQVFTVEVAGVDGSRVQQRIAVEGGETLQGVVEGDQLRFAAYPVSSSVSVLEFAPYAPGLYGRPAASPSAYPVVAGATWKIDRPGYGDEQVKVPAGTFTALRVEIKGTSPTFGGSAFTSANTPTRFTFTAWYAPELRRYVKTRHQVWNRFNQPIGDEIVQLVGYQAGK